MVAVTPPLLLPKPTPSFPLRYGLFQAAVGPLDLPTHGTQGGLNYVDAMCGPGFGYEVECAANLNSKTSSFTSGTETVLGVPFIVYATLTCPAVGFTSGESAALLRQRLFSVEQSIVEAVFSEGTFAQAPSLANNPDVVTVTGGGTTVLDVISELETAFYCTTGYGAPAYLHMPIAPFNELVSEHFLVFDGQRWRTPLGSVISTGCYTGDEPDGDEPADGTFWIYITGQTAVWRSPDSQLITIPIEGSLNRVTNEVLGLIERPYVVTFECTPMAKAVTLWS